MGSPELAVKIQNLIKYQYFGCEEHGRYVDMGRLQYYESA
jgi:hypothetical protein